MREKNLWLLVINNRYREEKVVRERIQDLLAALVPANIESITVVTEADALPTQSYTFRTEDLQRFRVGLTSAEELTVLAPMREANRPPSAAIELYKKEQRYLALYFSAPPAYLLWKLDRKIQIQHRISRFPRRVSQPALL